ncbi:hypothetical protein [Streptomyces sp. NPDC018693]|uniref:hypothetical protein n=1 Tax=unclassified Streptomyces TaxID=2593676 RepID=UPI0037BD1547
MHPRPAHLRQAAGRRRTRGPRLRLQARWYHQARLRRKVYKAGRSKPLRDAMHEELVRRGSNLK